MTKYGQVTWSLSPRSKAKASGRLQSVSLKQTFYLSSSSVTEVLVCIDDTQMLFYNNKVYSEWERVQVSSHSTHNWSSQRQVFPGNWLHWYWQSKTMKKHYIHHKCKKETEKTALANKTNYILIWYVFCNTAIHRARKERGPYSYSFRASTGTTESTKFCYIWQTLSHNKTTATRST